MALMCASCAAVVRWGADHTLCRADLSRLAVIAFISAPD